MNSEWILQLGEIQKATGGEILSQPMPDCSGVSIDTRKPMPGHLFVAIQGDNFDAHDFLDQAVEQGARILLVSDEPKSLSVLKSQVSVIKVGDTTKALQDLSQYWRKKNSARVVAITGSNGKTTTKEFTAAIVKNNFKVFSTKGNLNNHWGVPLSLLSIQPDDEVAVLEMGMNHLGEIAVLTKIAQPDIVMVTNVGSSHIGEVGSIEGVRDAKKEIYDNAPNALSIFNLDNSFTAEMYKQFKSARPEGNFLTFSTEDKTQSASVSLQSSPMDLAQMQVQGRILNKKNSLSLQLTGSHNIYNLMGAASIALALGMKPEEIWKGLTLCRTGWGRNQLVHHKNGATIVFDAYNANPQSMQVMLEGLSSAPSNTGKRIVILGEMLELGEFSEQLHRDLGSAVAQAGVDVVWFMGPSKDHFAAGLSALGFDKKSILSSTYEEALAIEIENMLEPKDVVAIKGSRGMKLERVLASWHIAGF